MGCEIDRPRARRAHTLRRPHTCPISSNSMNASVKFQCAPRVATWYPACTAMTKNCIRREGAWRRDGEWGGVGWRVLSPDLRWRDSDGGASERQRERRRGRLRARAGWKRTLLQRARAPLLRACTICAAVSIRFQLGRYPAPVRK